MRVSGNTATDLSALQQQIEALPYDQVPAPNSVRQPPSPLRSLNEPEAEDYSRP